MTLQQVKALIRKMDPNLDEKSDTFKVATFLLASAFFGPNAKRLSLFTGLPFSFIKPHADRLRKSGVWQKDKVCCQWDKSDIGFWLDVCVAQGLVERKNEAHGEPPRSPLSGLLVPSEKAYRRATRAKA